MPVQLIYWQQVFHLKKLMSFFGEDINEAKKQAIKAAKSYAKIHKNSGSLTSYEDIEEAISSLSQSEIQAIKDLEIDESWPEAEKEFYVRVKSL